MSESIQGKHNAILENREKLILTGVTDVDSFIKAISELDNK